MDLQKIVNDKIQSMVVEQDIQKVIEQSVAEAVTKAVESQFRSYGAISKAIEGAIEEGLKIDFSDVPFESYNAQMLAAVKQRLGNFFAESASNRFMEEMDKLLAPAPSEMSLQGLVEAIVASWKTDEPWDADDLDDEATVEFEEHDWNKDSLSVKVWKQKGDRYNRENVHLYLSSGKIRISHRQAYNPTCLNEVDALIFKLYAAGTTITGLDDRDTSGWELTLKEYEY